MWGADDGDEKEERGDICKSFHGGADTSTKAYETTSTQTRAVQRKHILAYIDEAKEGGHTCEETELALGIPHQTCSARISELSDEGLIHDSGKRRYTVRRKKARVYRSGAGPEPGKRRKKVGKEEAAVARDLKHVRALFRDCTAHPGYLFGVHKTPVLKGAADGCDQCLAALMAYIRTPDQITK